MSQAASIDRIVIPLRPNGRGPALGWGISLLVHVLGIAWVWHTWPARPADADTAPGRQIEVRLIPPAPRAAPAQPAAAPVSSPPPAPTIKIPRAGAMPPRSGPAPAPPPAAVGVAPAVPGTPASPSAPAEAPGDAATDPDTPTVDLASARAAARLIARENPKGLVALPQRKPVVDPNENHHVVDPIERARRVDCQSARSQSTNLLANVVGLAMDLAKNAIDDSGCKWR